MVEGSPGPGAAAPAARGRRAGGRPTAPARVSPVGPDGLRITIHEGRNRQVRRMCEAVGHPVAAWCARRIGPVRTGTLAPGEWRALAPGEVRALEQAVRAVGAPDRPA